MSFCGMVMQVIGRVWACGLVRGVLLERECWHAVLYIHYLKPKPSCLVCLMFIEQKESG